MEALRLAGNPASASELNQWVPLIAGSNNASVTILEAANSMSPLPPKTEFPARAESLSPEMRELLRSWVATNGTALAVVATLDDPMTARFPIDYSAGPATLLPHLAPVKSLVQLTKATAILDAQSGNSNGALQSIHDALRISRSLESEPILISQLVRIACLHIAMQSFESLLSHCALSDADLLALEQAIEAGERAGHEATTRALIGERAIGNDCFDVPLPKLLPMTAASSPQTVFEFLPGGIGGMDGLARTVGLVARDRLFYLRTMSRYVAASSRPFPEALHETQRVNAALPGQLEQNRSFVRSRMLLPSMGNAIEKFATATARLRIARTAAAIERFRTHHGGEGPASLADLVPNWIAAVPTDPFDGAPVRYRRTERGYIVYSIGPDLTDDDGADPTEARRRTSRRDREPRDVTFAVERGVR